MEKEVRWGKGLFRYAKKCVRVYRIDDGAGQKTRNLRRYPNVGVIIAMIESYLIILVV